MRSDTYSWTKALTNLGSVRKRRRNQKKHRFARPLRVEGLEDRRMLATVTVTTNLDDISDGGDTSSIANLIANPGSNGISLREAIIAANADTTADTILFSTDPTHGLNGGTIMLTETPVDASRLQITQGVTIDASMLPDEITIDANDADGVDNGNGSRVFDISVFGDAEVHLINLGITGGDVANGGGAIRFRGTDTTKLEIEDCLIYDNFDFNSVGGLSAGNLGGGDGGAIEILGSTFENNRGPNGAGGVRLSASTSVTITDSFFLSNRGDVGGGVAMLRGGNLTISGTEFIGNEATSAGGGLHIDRYAGGSSLSGGQLVTIEDSRFADNAALGSRIEEGGGAILADLRGAPNTPITLNIVNSTLAENESTTEGGGLKVFTKYGATVNVNNSTLVDNTAGIRGGGIWAAPFAFQAGAEMFVNLTHVTVSDNHAVDQGGGLWLGFIEANDIDVELHTSLRHVTITGNVSPDGGGLFSDPDLINQNTDVFTTLRHTVVSGNVVSATDSTPSNVAGVIENSSEWNLFGTSTAPLPATNNILNNNSPGLGPLADNGGPTLTRALLPGSAAIDAGDPDFTPPPDYDQRGEPFARVIGGRIDIGALEFECSADFDGDGDVDGRDFLTWQRGFGSGTTHPQGDADLDSDVDGDDLTCWQEQYGMSTATIVSERAAAVVSDDPAGAAPDDFDLETDVFAYQQTDVAEELPPGFFIILEIPVSGTHQQQLSTRRSRLEHRDEVFDRLLPMRFGNPIPIAGNVSGSIRTPSMSIIRRPQDQVTWRLPLFSVKLRIYLGKYSAGGGDTWSAEVDSSVQQY